MPPPAARALLEPASEALPMRIMPPSGCALGALGAEAACGTAEPCPATCSSGGPMASRGRPNRWAGDRPCADAPAGVAVEAPISDGGGFRSHPVKTPNAIGTNKAMRYNTVWFSGSP